MTATADALKAPAGPFEIAETIQISPNDTVGSIQETCLIQHIQYLEISHHAVV